MDISTELPPVKGRRVKRLLNEANQVCRALEILSQINESKTSAPLMPLNVFNRAMANEFESRIKKAFPWSKDKALVGRLTFYVIGKIRFATRMCRPKLFFGRLDPNRQDIFIRQEISEQA